MISWTYLSGILFLKPCFATYPSFLKTRSLLSVIFLKKKKKILNLKSKQSVIMVPSFMLQFQTTQEGINGFMLSGEGSDDIKISKDGWLYLDKPLDWSKENHYILKVRQSSCPYEQTIILIDYNSNTANMHALCVFVLNYVQVEALADGEVVDGPIYVTINVLDINNNAPFFNQSGYTALVREHTTAGVAFTSA